VGRLAALASAVRVIGRLRSRERFAYLVIALRLLSEFAKPLVVGTVFTLCLRAAAPGRLRGACEACAIPLGLGSGCAAARCGSQDRWFPGVCASLLWALVVSPGFDRRGCHVAPDWRERPKRVVLSWRVPAVASCCVPSPRHGIRDDDDAEFCADQRPRLICCRSGSSTAPAHRFWFFSVISPSQLLGAAYRGELGLGQPLRHDFPDGFVALHDLAAGVSRLRHAGFPRFFLRTAGGR